MSFQLHGQEVLRLTDGQVLFDALGAGSGGASGGGGYLHHGRLGDGWTIQLDLAQATGRDTDVPGLKLDANNRKVGPESMQQMEAGRTLHAGRRFLSCTCTCTYGGRRHKSTWPVPSCLHYPLQASVASCGAAGLLQRCCSWAGLLSVLPSHGQ